MFLNSLDLLVDDILWQPNELCVLKLCHLECMNTHLQPMMLL